MGKEMERIRRVMRLGRREGGGARRRGKVREPVREREKEEKEEEGQGRRKKSRRGRKKV